MEMENEVERETERHSATLQHNYRNYWQEGRESIQGEKKRKLSSATQFLSGLYGWLFKRRTTPLRRSDELGRKTENIDRTVRERLAVNVFADQRCYGCSSWANGVT